MTGVNHLNTAATLDLDLRGVNLIEASAGTGKTYTLANLYLRQLLAGFEPAEILVVSFTNAATDELLQRIQARTRLALQSFQTGVDNDDEFLQLLSDRHETGDAADREISVRRLRYALRSMDEAAISTIHGFCQTALRDHALLCNQRFEAAIITSDEAYWERALKDWWRKHCYPMTSAQWQVFSQAVPSLDGFIRWQRELRLHGQSRILPETETALASLLESCPEPTDPGWHAALDKIRARALNEARNEAGQQVTREKQAAGEVAYQDQLDQLLAALRGPHGDTLAARLRERFPVAMIDEFQDTDDTQFQIFERLYFGQEENRLVLIGDPKQAIYSFRGSDIFTYMQARNAPGVKIHSLRTNWRSTPDLIEAVNHLFSARPAPFVYDQDIQFQPAIAAPGKTPSILSIANQQTRAMTLWRIPLQDNGKVFPLKEMRPRVCLAVASEIARLLDPKAEVLFEGRRLRPGDIAILVRRRDEGEDIRAALNRAGIASVTVGRQSVLHSEEASGLFDLLEGIAHPNDASRVRQARASSLLAPDYNELDSELNQDDRWQDWIDQLQALRLRWQTTGFIAMFQSLHETLELGARLARRDQAERRLTNLGHLGEILQRQSRRMPGTEALLAWFRRKIDEDTDEENELRLESDGDLVRIVTIHRSKGLEYPVVFLPFPWLCQRAGYRPQWFRYHVDGASQFSVAQNEFEIQEPLADKERLAEDLRLLYVALTRAQSKLYLAWGTAGSGAAAGLAANSALGWLLHSEQTPQDLDHEIPKAFANNADLAPALLELEQECAQLEVRDLPDETEPVRIDLTSTAGPPGEAREFDPPKTPAWRVGSFSALTRDVHQVSTPVTGRSEGDPILDFPAGSHIGLLLHELLEHLDFQKPETQLVDLIAERASIFGLLREEQHGVLADWINDVLKTGIDGQGLQLGQLPMHRRLNELAFDFAVDRFDIDAINTWLQKQTETPLQPMTGTEFRGLVTGVIDLVFEYQGKYYLADYKSNLLGHALEDYRPDRLAQAMLDRRYDLQSWLYTLALHRYLRQRLPGYDYATHFGGSYYLFLRAMRPQHGPAFGVHFELPDYAQLTALEHILIGSDQQGDSG